MLNRALSNGRARAALFVGCLLFTPDLGEAKLQSFMDERGILHIYYRPEPGLTPRAHGDSKSTKEREQMLMDTIERIATEHSVDPALVRAVIRVESNFYPEAVSPKGASGLMQLMPATAEAYGVDDLFDTEQNIEGGVLYLKHLQERYGADLKAIVAAYNAGETAVDRAGGTIPEYKETQQYVVDVLHHYEKRGGKVDELPASPPPRQAAPAPARKRTSSKTPKTSSKPVRMYVDPQGRLVITNVR